MSDFLFGLYPYLCLVLFFVVPFVRKVHLREAPPPGAVMNNAALGMTVLGMHAALLLIFVGHAAGWASTFVWPASLASVFYWCALVGGIMVCLGACVVLFSRVFVAKYRATSRPEHYLGLAFLIAIPGVALYRVLVEKSFGVAGVVGAWATSLLALDPKPELIAQLDLLTRVHVLLSLTFLAMLSFTGELIAHVWRYARLAVRPSTPRAIARPR